LNVPLLEANFINCRTLFVPCQHCCVIEVPGRGFIIS
jgi:hypothetical protein